MDRLPFRLLSLSLLYPLTSAPIDWITTSIAIVLGEVRQQASLKDDVGKTALPLQKLLMT
jgi:hypothetical protein